MDIYNLWTFIIYGHLWTFMDIYNLWTFMDIYGHLWTFMDYGCENMSECVRWIDMWL